MKDDMLPEVVSIDPPMSSDLDDAVSATRTDEGGWIVDVCVPDVPDMVKPGSPSDVDARRVVMTRYGGSFIRQAMLPPAAIHALSLSPRITTPMCWFRISLSPDLAVVDVDIRRIRHRTAARLTYLEADEALGDPMHPWHARISTMWDLTMALHARRRARTGAAFDPEQHLYTTEEGILVQLSTKESHRTHLLVMEMMILANGALAEHARDAGIPVIFRNHKPVDASSGLREDVVREMQTLAGLDPAEALDRLRVLGSRIGPATFGSKAEGHWGLDVPAYAWFTSPLRRYCDIVNLRALLHGLRDEDVDGTAAHIETVTRETKESNSRHHGLRMRTRLAQDIRKGRASIVADADLHTIMKAAHENSLPYDVVKDEIGSRLASGRVTGKDVESMFTHGRAVLPPEALNEVVEWVLADRQRQLVLARDMVVRQRLTRLPTLENGSPDLAVAMIEISAVLGFDMPEGWKPEPVTHLNDEGDPVIPHPNAKGALLELATLRGAVVEFEETARVGPIHRPRFTIEARWLHDGGMIASRASASTVKHATHAAAWDVLGRVPELAVTPDTTVDLGDLAGKPAKSMLLEHATRCGGNVDFAITGRSGPPHAPVFTVTVKYRQGSTTVEAQESASGKKEAERLASQAVLRKLAASR